MSPSRYRYGAYISKKQIAELVAPHPDTLSLVTSWLEDHGIPPSSVSMTLGGNWLMAIGVPVSQADDILSASYQRYRNNETKDIVLRTVSYSLPDVLHGHIQTVVPTTYFGSTLMKWEKPRVLSRGVAAEREKAGSKELVTVRDPLAFVTPGIVRWLYKTYGYEPAAVTQNKFATAHYINQYPNPWDLMDFMEVYRTDALAATCSVVLVNGGMYNWDNPGVEASLSLQFASAMTYPTPHIFYSTGGQPGSPSDPYVRWLAYMLAQETLPQTISTSYSNNEFDVPPDYAIYVCNEFMKLGSRGVSVLFSTGDSGVGRGRCLFQTSSGDVIRQFLPQFPASCTYGFLSL